MAQSPRGGCQVQKEEERPSEGDPQNSTATGTWRHHGENVQRQTERVVEIGRERMQQATEASAAAASENLYARVRQLPVTRKRSPRHGRAMPRK